MWAALGWQQGAMCSDTVTHTELPPYTQGVDHISLAHSGTKEQLGKWVSFEMRTRAAPN